MTCSYRGFSEVLFIPTMFQARNHASSFDAMSERAAEMMTEEENTNTTENENADQ